MENQNIFINNNMITEIPKEELDYIQQILLCLENTYKSPDKEIRKKSEQFLKQAEKDLFSHLIQIFSFIKKNTLSKELNNAFIIFIRNSIINKKKFEFIIQRKLHRINYVNN